MPRSSILALRCLPQMIDILGLDPAALPIIWDADFLYGPRDAAGADSYVLCEVKVSFCFAIPDEAPAAIARLALDHCRNGPLRRRSRTSLPRMAESRSD